MCATWLDGLVLAVGWVALGVTVLFLIGLPVAILAGRHFRRREQRDPFG